MLKSLEIFVYKKAAVLFALMTAAVLILTKDPAAAAGLTFGFLLGIWRFKATARSFRHMAAGSTAPRPLIAALRTASVFMLGQLLLLPALFLALKADQGLFISLAAGVLIVPTVVFISAITESAGLTHHQFQSKVFR